MLLTGLFQALRKLFWAIVVEGNFGLKEEAAFEFKCIPDLHKTTLLERSERLNKSNEGVERRNLRVILIGCALMAPTTFVAVRFVSGLVDLTSA